MLVSTVLQPAVTGRTPSKKINISIKATTYSKAERYILYAAIFSLETVNSAHNIQNIARTSYNICEKASF